MLTKQEQNMKNRRKIAILLSSHDDSCCRSHSIRNLLFLIRIAEVEREVDIDVYIHPAEFSILYRLFALRIFPKSGLKFFSRCHDLATYTTVYSVFSSALNGQKIHKLFIYDPCLKENYIKSIFVNADFLY